jgi:hypothetical protein
MHPDFLDMFQILLAHNVRFIIIGGYAVAHAGLVRTTKDLDLWIEPDAHNAHQLIMALREFGAPLRLHGISEDTFLAPDAVYQIGVEPIRIDLVTFCDGVSFEPAWGRAELANYEGVQVPVLSFEDLRTNKLTLARPQDLADITRLEALRQER